MNIITDCFQTLKNNRTAKVLASNFIWLSILKLLGFVFPLITLPYLSRVIGVENFGIISYAASIIYFLELFVDFGFNYTATRDVAKNRENHTKIESIYSDVFWAKNTLMFIGLLILLVVVLLVPQCKENALLIIITFLYIPGHILFPDWFFQAMEDMKYISILNILSKCLFTVLVFVFIKDKNDYILQPLLTAVGFWVSGIISIVFIRNKYNIAICKPRLNNIVRILKSSINMFVCQFIPSLYSNYSVIALQHFAGSSNVGIFTSGKRIPDILSQVASLLSRVFFPYLARNVSKHSIYVYLNIIISLCLSIPLYFSADIIINIFFTDEFRAAADVIRIYAISLPFQFIDNCFGNNYLVVVGKENILMKNVFIGSFLGIILTILLIKSYGYLGAALTFLVIRVYFAISNFILARHQKRTQSSINI